MSDNPNEVCIRASPVEACQLSVSSTTSAKLRREKGGRHFLMRRALHANEDQIDERTHYWSGNVRSPRGLWGRVDGVARMRRRR